MSDFLRFWESPLYLRLYPWRRAVTMGLYSLVAAAAYEVAYILRFEFDVPPEQMRTFLWSLPVLLAIRLLFNTWFGLTTSRWRYVSTRDIVRLFFASTVGTVVFFIVAGLMSFQPVVPRSVILFEWVLNTYGTAGLWLSYRTGFEELRRRTMRSKKPSKRVLLVGAGEAANLLAREMVRFPTGYQPVGFVDDHIGRVGATLHGLPVLGVLSSIPALVARHEVDEIIVAIPSASPERLREIVGYCESTPIPFKILPGIQEVLQGDVRLDQLREMRIEDLLGRPAIRLELPELAEDLRDRAVLVTGAAGSIGSELSRQIAMHGPARLVLMDQAETDLFFLNTDLQRQYPELLIVPVVGDITNRATVERIFRLHSPDRVFHAAAYKHVPLMEANATEAIRNNVLGTLRVAEAAGRFKAARFILVSTDKAVRPVSVMGATKRMAELIVLELQASYPETAYAAVRFGNVLGSNGSVIPLFKRQIEAGLPLTVTHEEATRYFMTIPEAVQLILQASLIRHLSGHVFMLEMGEPIRIMDLARNILRLAGRPATARHIVITGLRPGERLHEELVAPDEETIPTEIAQVRTVRTRNGTTNSYLGVATEWQTALDRGLDTDMVRQFAMLFEGVVPIMAEEPPAASGSGLRIG